MADKTLSEIKPQTGQEKNLNRDYTEDLDAHDSAIGDYDAYEAMDMGKTYDPVSRQTGNGLTDNMTATIYLERAARVAGQLPEGETLAFGKKDYGKGMFLDLLRTKWINPNANSQFDFLTKMFIWQYGSSEYNVMPMHYDIVVNETTGYIGPDCWLWSPRNFIPQSGFTSISDMDYVHAISYKSVRFFEDILDDDEDDTWDKDAIRSILTQLKNTTRTADSKRDTLSYRERMKQSTRQICVATRYEAGKKGRWITFLPDMGCKVLRNIANPHENARIPFVLKRCIPKLDSYYGNGDFQRSMPMQFANDGLDNFYFQGIKVNLFPAMMINMQTAIRHTISQEPGAVMEFNGTPDAKRLETSTAGLSTYQAAKGMAKGAIQSIAGTTDTRSNADSASDPGFGKTPEALKQIAEREGTRDNFDRGLLERAMAELYDGMYSIIPTIADDIPIDVFSKEIEEIIESGYTDLSEMFKHWEASENASYRMSESGNQMRIKLNPAAFKNITARFEVKANSTAKQTREQQLEAIQQFWLFIGKMPNALDQYQQATGKVPDWDYVFGEMGKLYDLPFLQKMFTTPGAPGQPPSPAGQAPTVPGAQPTPQPGMTPQPPVAGNPGQPPVPPQPGAEGGQPQLLTPEMVMGGGQPQGAQPPQMPEGMQPSQQPPQQAAQPDPEALKLIASASPENPVRVGNYNFTNPSLAMEAYQMALRAGVA